MDRPRSRPGAATAVALTALLACAAHAPHGLLRVELDPDSPDALRLARAVQEAVQTDDLGCVPETGAVILRCSPASLGNRGHTVTVVVSRVGNGYQVAIDQAWLLPGRTSAVCSLQRRIASAIAAELSPSAARVDARSECKER